jgi:hypothetical protein
LLDHASETLPQLFEQRTKDKESGYVSLDSQVNIFCTENEANELLVIAERDCTGAVSAIRTGIRIGDEEPPAEKKS